MSETPASAAQTAVGAGPPGAGEVGVPDAANAPPPVQAQPHPAAAPVETGAAAPVETGAASPVSQGDAGAAPSATRRLPDPSKVNMGWWIFAILLLAAAVLWSVVAAEGTAFTHAHRASAAGAALLDVAALAVLAHVILLWYQSRLTSGPAAEAVQETLDYRRRGLKAAVMGQDGRASTSKTQVVLWTGAVVWALIDLLLLIRAYPGRNPFTNAVARNWRPEYLVLLGLPVAAAATAKAVVNGSNNGRGPVSKDSQHAAAMAAQAARVYTRKSLDPKVKGFFAGVAELISADDGTVAWADMQYVVFTLITLVYFVVQVLAQPGQGLPPVPAALLTLMGVSASGYTASKIVETKGGNTQGQAKQG